ncbi:MAG: AAA family ATPase [Fulvivirga sp.]
MERTRKQQITTAINEWLSHEGRSGAQLAEHAGVNAAYISLIKKGNYEVSSANGNTPISDKAFNQLANALGITWETTRHWETHNYRKIMSLCKSTQKQKRRALLDADTGLGKTYALESYASKNDKVLYIKVTRTMSQKDMLDEIVKKLRIKDILRGNRSKMMAIQKKVINTPDFLIIIDEAEYLKNTLFDLVKEIADFTHRKCGMILSGMDLRQKIEFLAAKHKHGFPQLKRRFFPNIMQIQDMGSKTKGRKAEVEEICKSEGITETTAINVFKQYVYDYDMLAQWIADVRAFIEREGRQITGQEMIELFDLNY